MMTRVSCHGELRSRVVFAGKARTGLTYGIANLGLFLHWCGRHISASHDHSIEPLIFIERYLRVQEIIRKTSLGDKHYASLIDLMEVPVLQVLLKTSCFCVTALYDLDNLIDFYQPILGLQVFRHFPCNGRLLERWDVSHEYNRRALDGFVMWTWKSAIRLWVSWNLNGQNKSS